DGKTSVVPVRGQVQRYNRPWLAVCEAVFCLPDSALKEGRPDEDPLEISPLKEQCDLETELPLCPGDWTRVLGRLFTDEDAPRWVMLLAGSRVLLLDRHTYAQGRYVAFDLDDAFGRKEKSCFDVLATFLAAETLCPGGEVVQVLHDRLEARSHAFAHGVS